MTGVGVCLSPDVLKRPAPPPGDAPVPVSPYRLLRPLLFCLDAEAAHTVAVRAARLAQRLPAPLLTQPFGYERPALQQDLWGLSFPNPVGLAAGFDKNAHLVPFWERVGMGFVEVGSVSARAAAGNARPRAFRLPADRALVNRMGLNNGGAAAVARRLSHTAHERPLGVNLAKTHDPSVMGAAALDDFARSFRLLAPRAGYVALNVSCPNTREGKTFEAPDALDALLQRIFAERSGLGLDVPVLVKLSPPPPGEDPEAGALRETVRCAMAHDVAGFVATNTASDRDGLATAPGRLERIGPGGLSGAPLCDRATRTVRALYRLTEGAVPIVGVGGIDSAEAAYARIRAGASLVQLYTGLVYEGPGLVRRIKRGLAERLERDGLASVEEAVGADI